jgi:hypothetical protein
VEDFVVEFSENQRGNFAGNQIEDKIFEKGGRIIPVRVDGCVRMEGEEWGIYRGKKRRIAYCLQHKWGCRSTSAISYCRIIRAYEHS